MLTLNNHKREEREGVPMETQHITDHEAILDMLSNVEHPHDVSLQFKESDSDNSLIRWMAVCHQCDGRIFGQIKLTKPPAPEGGPPVNEGPQAILDWATSAELNSTDYWDSVWEKHRERHDQRDDILQRDDMPEGLKEYLAGSFMRHGDRGQAAPASDIELWAAQIDEVMKPHGKSETVFRGISHIPDGSDRNLMTAKTWYEDHHYVSTSTGMKTPWQFASNPIGLAKLGVMSITEVLEASVNKTIMQIEITPNVKTVVCESSQSEIVIERNAVFEIQNVWQGLTMMHEPLYQYVQIRVHPPGTTPSGRSHGLL